MLLKLRALTDILAVRTPAESAARARQDRKLAEIIDLIWQTDELRQVRPTPVDEARNALFYLEPIVADTIPELTDDLAVAMAVHGVELSPEATPLLLGSWIGGDRDGNPNVTAAITHEVLQLQHLAAIKIAINKIDDLLMALSSSTAIVGVSDELLESIAVDLEHLPLLDPRVKELNREEPVRLKLTCIKAKLINTRARVTNDRPHEPGRDYSARSELLADLAVLRRSLLANGGELAANGMLATVQRTLAVSGLNTAYMDIREHSEAHHQVLAQLIDRLGEHDRPYNDLTRERAAGPPVGRAHLAPTADLAAGAAGRRRHQDVLGLLRDQGRAGDVRPGGDRHLHHLDDDGIGRHPGCCRAGQGGRLARHLWHPG